jgi:2-dehydropantoate 2-reductase
MKVCIYGAGAIGGWVGAKLARAGCETSVVARGATLDNLRANGAALQEGGETLAAPVQASASPAELGVQDLVVVAVKAPAMAEVAKAIAPLLGPDTTVLTAMNGVPWWFFQGFGGSYAGTRLEAGRSRRRHRAVGAGYAHRRLRGPRELRAQGARLRAAPLRQQADHRRAFRRRVAARAGPGRAAGAAGFEAVVSEQIQKDAWYKLWGNMTVNPSAR